ncbi:MAG: putative ABC transporter permease [Flavonifractor plautii]
MGASLALLAADIAGTVLTLCGVRSSLPPLENLNSRLAALSVRLGEWILRRAEGRIQKAHPGAVFSRSAGKDHRQPLCPGASFYSILLLFFIGGVAGDLAETIFCRLKMGWWMSRSSVVWGPFSIVWGLALATATLFLYKYRDRSASFFFVAGTLLGGLYEYLCGVFTELVFGTVFWDYSAIPFNLGGRINLLYCFFWGFAAVAWFRGSTPSWPAGSPRFHRAPGKRWSGCSSPSCPSIWRSAAWPWHATAPGPPESPPTRPGSSTWMPTTVTT